MSGEDLVILSTGDPEDEIRRELDCSLGSDRQQQHRRLVMAALSSIPWIGGLIAAAAALSAETDQQRINELQQAWLEEHRQKIHDLGTTLSEIVTRLEGLGENARERFESDGYLVLVRRAFRTWDQADTEEKRQLVKHLLMNAGGTSLCPDDLVRLFIQWIEYYHEAHFALIRTLYQTPGSTRASMWDDLHAEEVRENSAEADLFKLLIRDLSTGGIIRQHRQTTADGEFLRKSSTRRPKGFAATRTMKSAFDNEDAYELTELGEQFVHYTMNDIVPRVGSGKQ